MGVEAPPIGGVLDGKYRLLREVAAGAMGRLVEAEHLLLERPVAIKFLLQTSDERSRRRVLREAQAARALSSEHVVRVFDVGLVGEAPYIVMELLEGRDLATLVDERGPLPVSEAVDYLIQACAGVMEAHAAGVVHRDIKPSNLFLTRTAGGAPLVKVLDFGISKLREATSREASSELTGEGALLGSPYYMSPEQLRNPARVDGRTDVWALAVTLFHLLTAEHPFDGDTVNEVSAAIHADHPRDLSQLRAGTPDELRQVIERALAKRPEERTSTPADLARELAVFASARGQLAAQRLESSHPEPAPLPRPSRPSEPVIVRSGDLTATDAELAQTRPAAELPSPRENRRWTLAALGAIALGVATTIALLGWPRAHSTDELESAGAEPHAPQIDPRPDPPPPAAREAAVPAVAPNGTPSTEAASDQPASAPAKSQPAVVVRKAKAAPARASGSAQAPPAASSSPPAASAKPPRVDIDGIPIVE